MKYWTIWNLTLCVDESSNGVKKMWVVVLPHYQDHNAGSNSQWTCIHPVCHSLVLNSLRPNLVCWWIIIPPHNVLLLLFGGVHWNQVIPLTGNVCPCRSVCHTFVRKRSSKPHATKLGMMVHLHDPECHANDWGHIFKVNVTRRGQILRDYQVVQT